MVKMTLVKLVTMKTNKSCFAGGFAVNDGVWGYGSLEVGSKRP